MFPFPNFCIPSSLVSMISIRSQKEIPGNCYSSAPTSLRSFEIPTATRDELKYLNNLIFLRCCCCCCCTCLVMSDCCKPTDCQVPETTCQAPLSMGLSRQEYCSGLPFPSPRDLPDPGIKAGSPALQADSLLTELQGKPS